MTSATNAVMNNYSDVRYSDSPSYRLKDFTRFSQSPFVGTSSASEVNIKILKSKIDIAVSDWSNENSESTDPLNQEIIKNIEISKKDAYAFIECLIHSFPDYRLEYPEFSINRDGEICFEWYILDSIGLVVTIGSNGVIYWSEPFPKEGRYGKMNFSGSIPPQISTILHKLQND